MKKILVIEDESSLRREISDILSLGGYAVSEADNGITGYEKASVEIPDLILCDIMMSGMNGYEVLAALRKNQATKFIPLILITEMAERDNMSAGMELGADDYIVKPFESKELLRTIKIRLKISGTLSTKSDIALNELRLNLIQTLPHELRTPLNGILASGQLLMEMDESPAKEIVNEYGSMIYESGMRLLRFIQNYLLYAGLELNWNLGATSRRLEKINLVCENTARKTAARYSREEDLVTDCSPASVFASPDEFIKMCDELIDNAFKFSSRGKKVYVKCAKESNKFVLSVKDEGIGINPENLKRVGAYMQLDRFLNEQQGIGLGLAISKKIAEFFKGSLTVESSPGIGTSVKVIIPA
jgi:signal transduction histidine kinase